MMTNTSPRRPWIGPDDPIEKVMELTQRQFYNFVDQDVRGRLEDEVAEKLRDPMVVNRWHLALVQMKNSVESQLAAARADFRAEQHGMLMRLEEADGEGARALRQALHDRITQHESQRSKRLRFLSAVENSLAEARFHRSTVRQTSDEQAVRMLEAAIRLHRETIEPDAATDADRRLWAVTSERT